MKEEFRPIKGFEQSYWVSNHGNVLSLKCNKKKLLKPNINTAGYMYVVLSFRDINNKPKTKSMLVHILIAEAFLGHINPPRGIDPRFKFTVNHIDFNPINNMLDNLEIVTHRENTSLRKFKESRTSQYTGVYWNKKARKWFAQIVIEGRKQYLGLYHIELDAANAYNKRLQSYLNFE